MSSISSSFAAPTAAPDNIQDLESFQYSVAKGSPTALTAVATQPANALQVANCSPCPIKATITLQPPTPKGGEAPAPVTKEVVFKAGESFNLNFSQDVITEVLLEEGVEAPIDAITPDAGSAPVTEASLPLYAIVRFFNC